jgi:hypothetical protein
MSTDMFKRVSSQHNTHVYNGTIKTDHALTYVTIKEMRRPTVRGRQRQRKLKRKNRKRPHNEPTKLVFEKYQLQMFPEVRMAYASASSAHLGYWCNRVLPQIVDKERTSPQEAIDTAAMDVAKALYTAASASLPTRKLKKRAASRGKYPSKPRYWNSDVTYARRHCQCDPCKHTNTTDSTAHVMLHCAAHATDRREMTNSVNRSLSIAATKNRGRHSRSLDALGSDTLKLQLLLGSTHLSHLRNGSAE